MATKKKVELTNDQLKELKALAKAQEAAEEAREIRARFKGFVDDNLDALMERVTIGDLVLGVKISKQLTVEEA